MDINMKKGNVTIHELGFGHDGYGIEKKGMYPFLVRADIEDLKDLHSLLSELLETETCKHNFVGTYPSMKAECTLCGKAFSEVKEEPTTPEKKCWCGNAFGDCPSSHNQEKLPTSSYEVTCGRCEKSIKHSCGRV
jgi:hypothetical protein